MTPVAVLGSGCPRVPRLYGLIPVFARKSYQSREHVDACISLPGVYVCVDIDAISLI